MINQLPENSGREPCSGLWPEFIFSGGIEMICDVIKIGQECAFMTKKGCSYDGGKCYAIVERCQGCGRAMTFPAGQFCVSFPDPATKWSSRDCNMATHLVKTKVEVKEVNPLKASKRKMAGK
jgi:hypothetical protein